MIIRTKSKIAVCTAAASLILAALSFLFVNTRAEAETGRIKENTEVCRNELKEKDDRINQLRRKADVLETRNREVTQDIDNLLAQLDEADAKLSQREKDLKNTLRVWAVQQDVADKKIAILEKQEKEDETGTMNPMMRMMLDPSMQNLMIQQAVSWAKKENMKFFTEQNLDKKTIDAFLEEEARSQSEMMNSMLPLTMNPEAAQENTEGLELLGKELEKKHQGNLKKILGEEGYAAYQEYEYKRITESFNKRYREKIEKYENNLAKEEKLSKVQNKQLFELLITNENTLQGDGNTAPPSAATDSQEKIEEYFRKQKEKDELVLQKARDFLSETQALKLEKYMKEQRAEKKLNYEMIRSMFSGSSEKKSETSE